MLEELSALKDFSDLGGVFILALVLLYMQFRFNSSIEGKLIKILTLLAILVKTNTNFNGVDKVLGKDGDKVAQTILDSELA